MAKGIVHVFNEAGHRASYRDFLSERLDLASATGKIDAAMARRLVAADRLLFATVSGGTAFKAVLIAMVRALLGKRTSAICMSGRWYHDPARPVRSVLTRLLFRLLDATGRFRVFAIIPYELMPDLSRTTSDWILDLCLWDLPAHVSQGSLPQTPLSKQAIHTAAGRLIVVFLGRATARKGYSELADLARSIGSDVLIVSAGLVSEDCRSDANALRALGMIVEDRRISEEELISLYGVADYVWCRYDESSSSMSSGVFGRAVQLGRPAVVPSGSYLDSLARLLEHPVIHNLGDESLRPSACAPGEPHLSRRIGKQGEDRLTLMARESMQKLASSLSLLPY
jgi:hypothetical protein